MLAALLVVALAGSASVPAAPTRWLEDHAGFLSPAAANSLDGKLAAYEHATGHQVVVWIDRTIGGADLADWAARTFAAWKLGRKGLDDGVALFIFTDDRTIDIEVGYGLEDKIPDAIASRIIREVMTPRLQSGDADGAVSAGIDATLTAIEGKPWTATGTAGPAPTPLWQWIAYGALGLGTLVLLIVNPRLLWVFAMMIGRGGAGGFMGGGGRSGGGGARGRW
ncbi:MAG TPA: TPM domain-containing protein [Kofleriaceae bacterium]|nr:TPM domain-containing protein [Kofleriaceae bacterium]